MDLPSKYQIKEEVVATIEDQKYVARILAVIFEENSISYDVLIGDNMYAPDLEESQLAKKQKTKRWRVNLK
jgi:hypothetical protein